MMRRTITLILLALSGIAFSQAYVPGTSYFGRANYIEYVAGNLPLILSVPHGGTLEPAEIPDRTCGETVTDSYTKELAASIREEIMELTGCTPHIVICHLKRTKLDANREADIATCGNQFADTAWNEYHTFIDSATAAVERSWSKGLLIDIHGHGHAIQRLELGYLLSAVQLAYPDASLNQAAIIEISSIRSLAGMNVNNLTHADLLHGLHSLGTMFAAKGYPAVPGIDEPYPFPGEPYFSGGYITGRHGSSGKGSVDAIQMECNQDVRFEATARNSFAAASAAIFLNYLIRHYFPNLPDTYCNTPVIGLPDDGEFFIYPVPFSSSITVRVLSPGQLNIYNLQGELMISREVSGEESINTDGLKNGTYLAILSRGGKVIRRCKIVKGSIR
jgi:N-formylglutamate amidohydrolase